MGISNMMLESSLGKDERKFQLKALIDQKQVVTLQSAMKAMMLSKGTVTTYLKEMGYQMWDAEKDKFVGAKDGIRVGVDTV